MGLLLLGQCHHDPTGDVKPQEQAFGKSFVLEKGEEVAVSGKAAEKLTVRLSNLADSRCPEDVVCVWMGNAVVGLTVSNASEKNRQLQFCLGDCRPDPVRNKHTVRTELGQQAYDITVLEVLQLPNSKNPEEAKQVKVLVEPVG